MRQCVPCALSFPVAADRSGECWRGISSAAATRSPFSPAARIRQSGRPSTGTVRRRDSGRSISTAQTSASISPAAASTAATRPTIALKSTTHASHPPPSRPGHRIARKSAPRMAQCLHGDHLSPRPRPPHGREDRRARRPRPPRARYLELLHSRGARLGNSILQSRNAQHPQSRDALRDHLQPGPRKCIFGFVSTWYA